MESARKIPQKSVVRQRHPPPLFQRQVPPRVLGILLPRGSRIGRHGSLSGGFRFSLQGHLRPCDLPHAAQSGSRRRHALDVGQQLLQQRAPARGRTVLHRDGRSRCGRPLPRLLRSELAVGQGGEDGTSLRTHVEGRRHVLARDRTHRLLARKGTRRSGRAAEADPRRPDRLLPHRRPETVRPLQHPLAARHGVERRLRQRIHRDLRRSAGVQGFVGGQRQLRRLGGLPPHADHLRERPVVRRPLACRPRLQEKGRQGRLGQGHHRGDARRRLLPRHADRNQPSERRLDPQGARLEIGDDRQHHLRLRPRGARQRLRGGVHAAPRRPRADRRSKRRAPTSSASTTWATRSSSSWGSSPRSTWPRRNTPPTSSTA